MLGFGQQVERIEQERAVTLHFADGSTAEHDVLVGADVRAPCGDALKREHRLHIFGGFTSADVAGTGPNACVLIHGPTTQGSWTAIRHKGRDGQRWVLTVTDPDGSAPADLKGAATELAAGVSPPLPGLLPSPSRGTCSAGCCATARR